MHYKTPHFLYCNKSAPCYPHGMSTRMGRPTKAKSERRDSLIQVRLTSDEVKAVDRAAKQSGKKRSEWLRKVLTDALNVLL